MTDRRPFTYILLRYRHDPLAGECVNVGVVLHEPTSGFLDARVRHTLGRITQIFPNVDGAALKSALRSIERGVRKLGIQEARDLFSAGSDVLAFARRALPDDDSSFVWGPVGSGMTREPAAELSRLYGRFVGLYDEEAKPARDDAAIWRPVRERLLAKGLADRLTAKTIESPADQVVFDHAWKNGAWHCYQPLSFDLASADSIRDKAARWAGHMMGLRDSSEAFRPHFVVGSPSNPSLLVDYQRALLVLERSPVPTDIVEESDIDRLVSEIEGEITAHDRVVAD